MQAVILAAGRGTRLYPITENRTKAMCPVAGKPIVERVMDTLAVIGISEFILVINPEDADIVAHFKQNTSFDASLRFVYQHKQLGMGHALLQAAPFIEGDFLLSSCDSLVEARAVQRMMALWTSNSPPNGILTLLRVNPEKLVRMGVVEIDKNQYITRIVEKPLLEEAPSDIGSLPLYLFSPRLIEYLSVVEPSLRGEYELQDAIQSMIDKDGEVYGLLLQGRIELTAPEDLLRLNLHFLEKDPHLAEIHSLDFGVGTSFHPPVIIEKDVTIGSGCRIGPNVYVESGAVIQDDVELEDVVVLRGSQIKSGEKLVDQVIW